MTLNEPNYVSTDPCLEFGGEYHVFSFVHDVTDACGGAEDAAVRVEWFVNLDVLLAVQNIC